MSGCPDPGSGLGVVRSVIATVDCHVRLYSEGGYLALTGPHSFFPTALTVLLTIYVALVGLRLMFGIGGARLADAPLIAVKIGVVLTLTMNWSAFQTLVFDFTQLAPIEVARLVASPATGSGSDLAASPLDGLQTVYDELGEDATAFGKAAGPSPQILQGGEAAAADQLWSARRALFVGTAGVMAIAAIATGVLIAVGPIFIALFLFEQTRGLFAGWLRATLAVALTPMFGWITTAALLVAIDPWVAAMAKARAAGALDAQTAEVLTAVIFIFATAQAALAFGAGVIASGFQLGGARPPRRENVTSLQTAAASVNLSRAERLAYQLSHGAAMTSRSLATATATGAGAAAAGGSAGRAPRTGGAGEAWSPSLRVGDSYRRTAVFDRLRKPVANS